MKNKFLNKFFPKPASARKGEINYSFVDRFTLVHFMIGFAYGYLGFGFFLVLLFALAWEFFENPLKVYFPSVFPHASADSLQNSVGDCVAVLCGWMLSRYFN